VLTSYGKILLNGRRGKFLLAEVSKDIRGSVKTTFDSKTALQNKYAANETDPRRF
jgi:hypothetical protein